MIHIKFSQLETSKDMKTKRFQVESMFDDSPLGIIKWKAQWRTYCFFPITTYETFWSDDCLLELSSFINKLNSEQKTK